MPPPATAQKKTRRSRKRRRADSYEVSSDSDSDDSSSASPKAAKAAAAKAADKMDVDGESSDASSSSSTSSSDSSSSDSSDDSSDESDSGSSSASSSASRGKGKARAVLASTTQDEVRVRKRIPQIRENSPTPPPVSIPGFLASAAAQEGTEGDRRSQFRKVYMEKLVEGFGSDLDKLRTSDPTMNPARLKRLISGLQEAATLYEKSTTAGGQDGKVDEMSVVLGI